MPEIAIHRCSSLDQPGWLTLRTALWPHSTREEHVTEMAEMLREPERHIQFLAGTDDGRPVGLLEMSIRRDYVNGCENSPVVFLEGLFVVPEFRNKGVARQLVRAAESWAGSRGYSELASDALQENESAQAVHRALGFHETERVVFFRKAI